MLIIAGISWESADLYHRFNNTLSKSNNWISSKTKVENSLIGAAAFLSTRNALADEVLNLGAWHGGQEVVSVQKFEPQEISFDFSLVPGSHVAFLYDQGPRDTKGLLFSASRFVSSKIFRVDPRGGFIEKTQLPSLSLTPGKWYRARILFSSGRAELSLNGRFLANILALENSAFQVGFRGSIINSRVDNVLVQQRNGQLWNETFSRESLRKKVFAIVVVVLILLFTGTIFLAGKSVMTTVSFNLFFLFLFTTAANYFDGAHFVKRYFAEPVWIERKIHEDAVGQYFEHVENLENVLSRLNRTYFRDYRKKDFQILFLGSSQTWGTGASAKADIISSQFDVQLKRSLRSGSVFVYNAAVPGHRSWHQYEFLQFFEMKPPDMVIFNMSYNDDVGAEIFEESIRNIAAFCKTNNVQLVLVKEAMHISDLSRKRRANHLVLERLAPELGYPLVDLHEYMHSKEDSGFLWWDGVHMTSYGMSLAAEFLAEQLAAQISTLHQKTN